MKPIITYETVQQDNNHEVRVYAVLNKDFVVALTHSNLMEIFGTTPAGDVIFADDGRDFAIIMDADKNEKELTEAIDVVNDKGIETEIRSDRIENKLGIGPDINTTSSSLEEVYAKVKGWLEGHDFAPHGADIIEFPN